MAVEMVQWALLSIAVGKAKRRGKVCCFRQKRRVSSPAMRSGSMFQEHQFMLHPKSIPFLPVLIINHPISGHFRLPIDLSWLADHQQWPGSEDKPGFYTPKQVIGAHWDCISWKWSVCGVVWWVCVCMCVHACVCEREKDLRSTLQKGQSNVMLTAPLTHTLHEDKLKAGR